MRKENTSMNHKQYREWLGLLIYDELVAEERKELDLHLDGCSQCRAELEELMKFRSAVSHHQRLTMSYQLLMDARRQLRVAIEEKGEKSPLWERMIEPIYRISFSGIAMLAVGFVVGYMMSSTSQMQDIIGSDGTVVPIVEGGTRISNVQFIDADGSDGEIEFVFDAVRPVRMKGSVNDPQVQKVLAQALLNEKNPAVRLRSVGAMAEQPSQLHSREVREALLNALTSDPNPAVRMEAVNLLQQFPIDDEIKEAILYVLQNDSNSGVRVAVVNMLQSLKNNTLLKDSEVIRVLEEKTQNDDNNYIRLMARNVLEEIK
jgi:hypothetical protein